MKHACMDSCCLGLIGHGMFFFQTRKSIGVMAVLAQSGYSLQQRDMHHHQNTNCFSCMPDRASLYRSCCLTSTLTYLPTHLTAFLTQVLFAPAPLPLSPGSPLVFIFFACRCMHHVHSTCTQHRASVDKFAQCLLHAHRFMKAMLVTIVSELKGA